MFVHMQSIVAIEQQFLKELADLYDAHEVKQIFFLLLEHHMGWTKTDYLFLKKDILDEENSAWLAAALQELKTAKPVQYIAQEAWFMGMSLIVNNTVLIPRPETEELVNLIINNYRHRSQQQLRILDIGTGTGCIAIALKKAFPSSFTYALDISKDALQVARQNAEKHSANIEFIKADILEWEAYFQPEQRFDIVVSNPPYITIDEQVDMHQNVLTHEPHLALFVKGNTPLLFYTHIATFAMEHLRPQGNLYFEINRNYGNQVCAVLQKKGFDNVQLHQDMHGADRMVQAKKHHQ